MSDHPAIRVVTERGAELTPKEITISEDSEGVFLITITIDNAGLSGERTFGT